MTLLRKIKSGLSWLLGLEEQQHLEPEPEAKQSSPMPCDLKTEFCQVDPEPEPEIELSDGEIIEVVDKMLESSVSVEVKVHAPVDVATKISVKVDVEQSAVPESVTLPEDEPEFHSRYKTKGGGPGYWALYGKEGIKLSSVNKYHAVGMSRQIVLDDAAVDTAELSLLDDPEVRLYTEFLECDDMFSGGFSPSRQQVETYYALCRFYDEKGLPYNRRDRPENCREYDLAIWSLKRGLTKGLLVQFGRNMAAGNC